MSTKKQIREAHIRRQSVWEDEAKAITPVGKLFYELDLCRYAPDPLESFEAKRKEILLMLNDAELLNMEAEMWKEKRNEE